MLRNIIKFGFLAFLSCIFSLSFSSPALAQDQVNIQSQISFQAEPSPIIIGISPVAVIPNVFGFEDRRLEFGANKDQAMSDLEAYGCVTCDIFAIFSVEVFKGLERIDSEGRGLIPALAGIGTIFAFFYLFSAFVSGDAGDMLGRWQVFWRLCLALAAASAMLQSPVKYLWEYIYTPIFYLGEGVTRSIADVPNVTCNAREITGIYPEGANNILRLMANSICGAHEMTLDGMATGIALFYSSPAEFSGMLIFAIAGFCVLIIYGFLSIVFPLRFIDVVLKLGIVSILSPVLVLAAAFKPFRGYAMTGISAVLNAAAQFALLTIILRIGLNVLDAFRERLVIQSGPETSFGTMIVSSLALIAVAIVFSSLVKTVPSLAAELTRSSSGGGEGGSAAIRSIVAPAVVGAGAAGLAGRAGGQMAFRGLKKGVDSMKGASARGTGAGTTP